MILKVNGVDIPPPQDFTIDDNTQSTEDSGRDLSGTMHNTFLPSKWKITQVWTPQTKAERADLMSKLLPAGANLSALSIQFINPYTGEPETATFMRGTPFSQSGLNIGTPDFEMWDELTASFIEV